MNPHQLVEQMLEAAETHRQLVAKHPELYRAEAEADKLSKLAQANAYLASEGTVAERQAHVDKATADDQYRAKMAEGLRKSNQLAISAAESRITLLQSIGNIIRGEMRLAGVGE